MLFPFRSLLWLLLVILLSAGALAMLNRCEERQAVEQGDQMMGSATVMLVAYEGETGTGTELDGDLSHYERVGCKDILVPYEIPVVSKRLKSVLAALGTYNPPLGLHNPLRDARLVVEDVETQGRSAVLVELAGEPQLGGVCDTPRLKAQLEKTVVLYEEKFVIRLNGSEEAYKNL